MLASKLEVWIFEEAVEEAVEEDEELAETGGEGKEGFLAADQELLVMGLEGAVVADGGEGGHEKDAADGAPAAGDATGALEEAAVAVVGGDSDEGHQGLVAEQVQFGGSGHESGGDHRADAGHGTQPPNFGRELDVLGNQLGRLGCAGLDLGAKQADKLRRLAAQERVGVMGGAVGFAHPSLLEPAAALDQRGQTLRQVGWAAAPNSAMASAAMGSDLARRPQAGRDAGRGRLRCHRFQPRLPFALRLHRSRRGRTGSRSRSKPAS